MKKVSCSCRSVSFCLGFLLLLMLSVSVQGQPASQVTAWGDNFYGQLNVPPDLTNAVAIASGFAHNLALRSDGTVSAWGYNAFGQANVPAGLTNVSAITAGRYHSLALKQNGTLVPWGSSASGLLNVPAGLTNAVAIRAGSGHNLVIKSDGRVTGWGDNGSGQLNIPAGLSNVVAVAGGLSHSMALRANGTVAAWGDDSFHQIEVPPGLSNVVAIAAGDYHNVALRANGTVVAWGYDNNHQIDVPPGLSNVAAIACGYYTSLATKTNGSVVAWGQFQPPAGLTNVAALSAGNAHGLALGGLVPAIVAQPTNLTVVEFSNATFSVGAIGVPSVKYQWRFNGANLAGATASSFTLAAAHLSDAGSYSVVVFNGFGSVTSAPALLTVIPSVVARCADAIVSAGATCVANASIDAGSFDPSGGPITLTQSPPGPYPLGTNAVTLIVSNSHGGSASCTARVIVLDLTPPQFAPFGNVIAVNYPDQCGAVVTFAQPVASDCSAITQITCSPPSGSFFPVGTTTVQCAATDAVGNTVDTNFTVTVYDHQPPSLICPADIVLTNAPNTATSVVAYSPTATDNCPGLGPVVCDPPSGSAFGPGIHTIQCSVTDAAGNTSACSFRVTVWPGLVVRCADVTVSADSNCVANASIDAGSTNLNGAAITLTQTPPGPYPLGTNDVTLTVSDDHGSSGSCTARVIVLDRTPPQLTLPADILTPNDLDQCGAVVSFAQPAATDSCSAVTQITCTPPSGSLFPVGTTTVQCAATDAAGNTAIMSFTVTVRDNQPPVLTCPADMVVTNAPNTSTSVVTYNPGASDNCPGLGAVVCTPPSGTAFAPGVHTIQCSVTDAAGNSSACSFHVTVILKHAVTVTNPIPDQVGIFGAAFNYTIPPDTFADEDTRQTFTYAAFGLPPGINFTPETATFSGTFAAVGVFTVSVTATDNGEPFPLSATNTFVITVQKAAAVLNWPAPADIVYGTALGTAQLRATANTAGTFAYSPPIGTILHAGAGQTLSVSFTPDDDADYNPASTNVLLTVTRAPLSVAAASATKVYGQPNPPFTGNIWGIQNQDNITATYSSLATDTSPAGIYPIVPTLVDPDGKLGNYSVSLINGVLTITPAALSVTITGPSAGFVRSVDTNILFTGVFTPSGASGSYLAWWTFSSDGLADIVVPAIIADQTVSAWVPFAEPGVYNVSLTVSDAFGSTAVATNVNNDLPAYIVIYDPDGGFVTGGGWFNSTAGAYVLGPGLVGKATFGFVSKYQHGASVPTGQTVFTFQVADLNFHSTSYDWLLISGAKARYQGSGTINGGGEFAFILTAVDGRVNGGGGVDKLRIKIWEKQHNILIYDNSPGASDNSDPTTAIGAGSIVIHKE